MKIYVNRFPVSGPWGGGNMFVKAFHDLVPKAGHEVVPAGSMTVAPDAILIAGLDSDGQGASAEQLIMYKTLMETHGRHPKLVLRVNENDARKGTNNVDRYLQKLAPHMDGTVFVSHWLQEYFEEKGWPCSNNSVIINGVDREIFKPQPKLGDGKLNVVAHHWSDNRMKGADIYEKIDELVGQHPDRLSFTYIGRHKCNFKHTKVISPLSGKRLGEELGKYDLYVSASEADPGPNHILEALAAGLPTYVHANGGGCCEFAGVEHVYYTWGSLRSILLGEREIEPNASITLGDWSSCIQEYTNFLEATCQLPKNTSGSTSS